MRSARVAATTALGLATLALVGCENVLEVNNPEEIEEDRLSDPALINVLVASAKGDFEDAFDDPFIWRGSMLTDETLTGINWEQTARLSQRIVPFDDGDADFMFSDISRALQQADSTSGRLRQLLDNPSSDRRLAQTLAYAGYSYIILADAMCEATVNVGSEILQPLALYAIAVDRLEEALSVAQASNAPELANLARVGLSRAHLNLGNDDQVISFAQQVPDDFRYWAEYSAENPATDNVVATRTEGSNHSLAVHPEFVAGGPANFGEQGLTPLLTDPRLQHFPEWRLGHNRLTKIYTPYAPLMWSNWNGETLASGGQPAELERGSDIAFASGLEARHNMIEAMGPGPEMLAFVNERRAAGNMDPVDLSGDALVAELRHQRGIDLFLAGYRLGDLRRWLREGDDLFPSGQHPNEQWGQYGDATCYPLPRSEYEGNPNIPLPGS